jgi:hypothetical protein
MKSNITLKVDAELVRDAKILAAKRGTSVSRMLGDHLEQLIRDDRAYEVSKRRALDRLDRGFDLRWSPVDDRDELHER